VDWNLLSDISSQALTVALRGAAARQAALTNNLANVDTPGFIRTDVEFEQALAVALDQARRTPGRSGKRMEHIPLGFRQDRSSPPRADGNNVDIDGEMTALARNSLRYRAAAEMLSAHIRLLRTAIHQGRG
jgi:flagellar basal-body rod protein FlgB